MRRSRKTIRTYNPRSDTLIYKRVGLPSEYYTKLNYTTVINLRAATASTNQWQFLMDCFDLDSTGGGHQPLYFDQLCASTAPYGQYQVTGMKARLEWMTNPDETGISGPALASRVGYIWHNVVPLATTSLDRVEENRYSNIVTLSRAQASGKVTQKTYMSRRKLYGSPIKQNELTYGDYAANSAQPAYLTLVVFNSDSTVSGTSASQANVFCKVDLTLYVRFFKRNYEVQS